MSEDDLTARIAALIDEATELGPRVASLVAATIAARRAADALVPRSRSEIAEHVDAEMAWVKRVEDETGLTQLDGLLRQLSDVLSEAVERSN